MAAPDRGRRWVTERWALRRGKLFLMPGDSPAGFRLPLGSLAALPAVDYPARPAARSDRRRRRRCRSAAVLDQQRKAVTLRPRRCRRRQARSEIYGSVRTALTIEPRDGQLCVFMPPVEDADDYAALIAAIEEAARSDRAAGAHRGLLAARTIRASTSSR